MQVGWYSEKQSKHTGIFAYTTPDGCTVQVTEVITGETLISNWSDGKRVGEVIRYVGCVQEPTKYDFWDDDGGTWGYDWL